MVDNLAYSAWTRQKMIQWPQLWLERVVGLRVNL